ncbi:MAG TPA: hypothetical protein VIF14_07790 [Alphaproteobacteria bacterium]|jgi:hypothetical protein
MRKPLVAALAVLVSCLGSAALHAQTPGNMLAELGILGRWAADCRRPPGGNNPHLVFERTETGSGAQYTVIFAPSSATTRSVDNVRVLKPGTVAMHFTTVTGQSTGLAFDITMLLEPTRYRVVASTGSDGKVYIKDGIVVATGAENPWQNKCRD